MTEQGGTGPDETKPGVIGPTVGGPQRSEASAELPFRSRCTPGFAEILARSGSSIAFSTYKSGKVVILSVGDGGLVQLPRNFEKPMGLVVDGSRMAVAAREQIVVLGDAPALAQHYPANPGTYDHLWTPQASYFNAAIDTHDIAWSGDTLYGVNTRFSCLCTFGDRYSFEPVWQPDFITELMPEDRCHLNGLALVDGAPTWVTALGISDERRGWRENRVNGGVLIHVPSHQVVVGGLCMPHSPRVIDGELYLLNSGRGEILRVDPQRGRTETVCTLPGFARGLTRLGDYLVVGLSMLRDTRSFGGLPLEEQAEDLVCGVALVHRERGELAGMFYYETDCEELYDVAVMEGMRRPGIIGLEGDLHRRALQAPEFSAWAELRPHKSEPGPAPAEENPYLAAIRDRSHR